MALSIYSLFKIDIQNLVRDKVLIVKKFFIQPSEIDRMPFWEYEMVREQIIKFMDDEAKQHEQQKAEFDSRKNDVKMPKTPKMPSIKTPKL